MITRLFDKTFVRVNPEGHWLRVNKKLCRIVGYSEPELFKLTFQEITHPDDLVAGLAQAERVCNGSLEAYSMEKPYIRKDGSVVWVNLTVSGVRESGGKFRHFISVVGDISAAALAKGADFCFCNYFPTRLTAGISTLRMQPSNNRSRRGAARTVSLSSSALS
jgi:PAS domain S-box-containing protein